MDAEAGGIATDLGLEAVELRPGDPPPVTVVNPEAASPLLIIADHAGNAVPAAMNGLTLPPGCLDSHIGWDIGAAAVARRLAHRLNATAVLAAYSRLLIDPNRPLGEADSIPAQSDGIVIPANAALNGAASRARAAAFYWPYHGAIDGEIARLKRLFKSAGGNRVPVLFSVHSFTPAMKNRGDGGEAARPWHAGVMFSRDERLSDALIAALKTRPGMVVGVNQPYSGFTLGYCLKVHGLAQGIPHAQIEIRQDLICNAAGQAWWGDLLADLLPPILEMQDMRSVRHY